MEIPRIVGLNNCCPDRTDLRSNQVKRKDLFLDFLLGYSAWWFAARGTQLPEPRFILRWLHTGVDARFSQTARSISASAANLSASEN